jgi:hypothetical protein
MNIREEHTRQLVKGVAKTLDNLIEAGLPQDYDIRHIHRAVYPNGVEIFSYKGEEFLEVHPLQLETIREDHATKVKATWNYRYMNGKGPQSSGE